MLDFLAPFTAFTNRTDNASSFAIAQHYEARDLAIKRLIEMYHDDIDIADPQIFYAVLKNYNLPDDGFLEELDYIINEVERGISAWEPVDGLLSDLRVVPLCS